MNSQVVCVEVGNSVVGPNRINERLSGEKLSHRAIQGDSRVLIRSSVTESRISIFTGFDQATAMNLLHGDHTATSTTAWGPEAEITGSHETGNPCTTLAKGRAYGLHSSRTIEVRGDRRSAE